MTGKWLHERSIGVRVFSKGGQSGTWPNVYPSWALIPSLVSQRMGAKAFGPLSQDRVQDSLQWGHTVLCYLSQNCRIGLGMQT